MLYVERATAGNVTGALSVMLFASVGTDVTALGIAVFSGLRFATAADRRRTVL